MDKTLIFETKRYENPSCPINFFTKKFRAAESTREPYSHHYHNEIEFLYCLKGSLMVFAESNLFPLSEGDCLVIEPGLVHHTVKSEDVDYVCAIFPVLSHIIDSYPEGAGIFLGKNRITEKFAENIKSLPETKKLFASVFEEMLSAQKEGGGANMLIFKSGTARLLFYTLRVLNEHNSLPVDKNYSYSKILPAVEYINKNLKEHIDLNYLAALCHYNYFYFSRIFKRLTGMSVLEYISFERFKYSKMCLLESDMTVSEVAKISGFSSENAFYSYFKKAAGITPTAFREKNKNFNPRIG